MNLKHYSILANRRKEQKMKLGLEITETCFNVAGVAVGSELVETTYLWLGVVLLVINILSIVIKGVITFVKWYKKSKADGVITADELDEATKIVDDATSGITNEIDKYNKNKKA